MVAQVQAAMIMHGALTKGIREKKMVERQQPNIVTNTTPDR